MSRRLAAHIGGIESSPTRMTRKVLPQMAVQVANARRLREPPGWRDDSGMRSMGTAGEGG